MIQLVSLYLFEVALQRHLNPEKQEQYLRGTDRKVCLKPAVRATTPARTTQGAHPRWLADPGACVSAARSA